MNSFRILYHIARADFLERVRQYSFLLMLLLVVWIGYLSASGKFRISVLPDHIGVLNSAWIGATMTLTVTFALSWVGFYLVKGSVSRDYTTGVGQIMATTPLSRRLYMLGKWLSNFAVLGIALFIVLGEGILMNMLVGIGGLDLIALAAPLIIIALPCVGLVAAVAVLFESTHWLRGALGNIVYFFGFILAFSFTSLGGKAFAPGSSVGYFLDFSGFQIISDSVTRASQAVYPDSMNGISFGISPFSYPRTFLWEGISWTGSILLSRLLFLGIGAGLAFLAAVLFDRFNPSRLLSIKKAKAIPVSLQPIPAGEISPASNVRLTPIVGTHARFSFTGLFAAELKLLLKGQRWWWYAISAGLAIAPLFTGIEVTRILLLVAWVWPILILSGLGCRENRFDTRQLVFSAPRPVANQLPAAWLSGFVLTAALGFGALVKFILIGESIGILGWLTGAVFIPSFALAMGTLTGSGKAFEALFIAWMYLIYQKVAILDFMGLTSHSPWYFYIPLALVLLAIAALARQRQLKPR